MVFKVTSRTAQTTFPNSALEDRMLVNRTHDRTGTGEYIGLSGSCISHATGSTKTLMNHSGNSNFDNEVSELSEMFEEMFLEEA